MFEFIQIEALRDELLKPVVPLETARVVVILFVLDRLIAYIFFPEESVVENVEDFFEMSSVYS